MKTILVLKPILFVALAVTFLASAAGAADNVMDDIKLFRSTYKTDRQAILTESLQLTTSEGAAFWPLYQSYRADMDKIGDGLVKLVLEYAEVYQNVPEDRARQLLNDYVALEEKLVKKRAWYLKRANKSLPAAKVLLWAQLENRMDLALRLQLAGAIPMVTAP